jgi:hypothetical protein
MLYIDPWSRHGIATEHDRTSLRTLEIPSSQHVKLGLSTNQNQTVGNPRDPQYVYYIFTVAFQIWNSATNMKVLWFPRSYSKYLSRRKQWIHGAVGSMVDISMMSPLYSMVWCPHCISVVRSTKLPDSSISLNPDMFLQFLQPFPHKIPICPNWSPITFCWRWKQVDYYLAQLLSDQNCLAGGPNCSVKADVPKQRGCFTLFHITFCCVG